MCTKLNLRVKSISVAGVKRAFVPCGKCFDCRNKIRNDWVFRLRYDLDYLKKQGWQIGFFTLTYSDEFLPTIPYPLFEHTRFSAPSEPVGCFSKDDIRDFINRIRKAVLKKYKVKDLRWMVCSEFGEHTRRSHYHGIICFPPSVDANWMFEKIHQVWYRGFVFPRNFGGGYDSHGYDHKPFICDSVKAAASYAAKYVCKDIAYMRTLDKYRFRKVMPVYRHDIQWVDDFDYDFSESFVNEMITDVVWKTPIKRLASVRVGDTPLKVFKLSDYMPFHMQSRQLGSKIVHMSDDKKIYALRHGFSFLGDDMLSPLPVYVREKLLFTPKYVVRDGKRLVEREANDFFMAHAEEIFDAKARKIEEQFDKFLSVDYWKSIGADLNEVDWLRDNVLSVYSSRELAESYLAFFGCDYHECKDISPAMQWLRRYTDKMDVGDAPLISLELYYSIHEAFFGLFTLFNRYDVRMCYEKQVRANDVAFVRDFYKHLT